MDKRRLRDHALACLVGSRSAALLSGCTFVTDRLELETARGKWERHGLSDYQFTLERR